MHRRRFLTHLAGLAALGSGLTACTYPDYYPESGVYGYPYSYYDYYYYPDANVYFHLYSGDYYYRHGGNWFRSRYLPAYIHLNPAYRRRLRIRERQPYERNHEHRGERGRRHDPEPSREPEPEPAGDAHRRSRPQEGGQDTGPRPERRARPEPQPRRIERDQSQPRTALPDDSGPQDTLPQRRTTGDDTQPAQGRRRTVETESPGPRVPEPELWPEDQPPPQ